MDHNATTILLFGDSIALGAAAIQDRHVLQTVEHSLFDLLTQAFPACGIRRDAQVQRTTTQALDDLPLALASHRPHIVVLMLGGNDADMNWRRFLLTSGTAVRSRLKPAQFSQNLRKLILMIRTAGAIPVLADIPDHDLAVRGRLMSDLTGLDALGMLMKNHVQAISDSVLNEFRMEIRQLATSEDVALADFAPMLDRFGKSNCIGPDGIHPNTFGHAIIADSLQSVLRPLILSWQRQKVSYA